MQPSRPCSRSSSGSSNSPLGWPKPGVAGAPNTLPAGLAGVPNGDAVWGAGAAAAAGWPKGLLAAALLAAAPKAPKGLPAAAGLCAPKADAAPNGALAAGAALLAAGAAPNPPKALLLAIEAAAPNTETGVEGLLAVVPNMLPGALAAAAAPKPKPGADAGVLAALLTAAPNVPNALLLAGEAGAAGAVPAAPKLTPLPKRAASPPAAALFARPRPSEPKLSDAAASLAAAPAAGAAVALLLAAPNGLLAAGAAAAAPNRPPPVEALLLVGKPIEGAAAAAGAAAGLLPASDAAAVVLARKALYRACAACAATADGMGGWPGLAMPTLASSF